MALQWVVANLVYAGSEIGLWCDEGPAQISISIPLVSSFPSLEFRASRLFALGHTTMSLQSLVMDGNSTLYSSASSLSLQSATCSFAAGSSLQGFGHTASLVCNTVQVTSSLPLARWDVIRFNLTGNVVLADGIHAHLETLVVSGDVFACPQRTCTVSFQNDVAFAVGKLSGGFYAGWNTGSGSVFFPQVTELNELMLAAGSDFDMLKVFISASLTLTGDVSFSYLYDCSDFFARLWLKSFSFLKGHSCFRQQAVTSPAVFNRRQCNLRKTGARLGFYFLFVQSVTALDVSERGCSRSGGGPGAARLAVSRSSQGQCAPLAGQSLFSGERELRTMVFGLCWLLLLVFLSFLFCLVLS